MEAIEIIMLTIMLIIDLLLSNPYIVLKIMLIAAIIWLAIRLLILLSENHAKKKQEERIRDYLLKGLIDENNNHRQ